MITILSEKSLPIAELGEEVQAVNGFNVIATANNRDRGVNELSSALRRRFNTVVLPLPVVGRAGSRDRPAAGRGDGPRPRPAGRGARPRGDPPDRDDLPRAPVRARPRTARTSSRSRPRRSRRPKRSRWSTQGLSLAAHFGDGRLKPKDVAAGLTGAIIRDPVQDAAVWREYLKTVMKERDGWRDLYRACREEADSTAAARP